MKRIFSVNHYSMIPKYGQVINKLIQKCESPAQKINWEIVVFYWHVDIFFQIS